VSSASAFGPEGHRVAGLVAETYLCTKARREVARLGGGADLARLGVWADRVRGDARWPGNAAWHYINVDDAEPLEHARGGNNLWWALEHFGAALADPSLPAAERGVALKFFVHFVVDAHQPLHVGREADRGGNAIELAFGDRASNLHRFWDSDVLRSTTPSAARYAGLIAPRAERLWRARRDSPPRAWLEESRALRAQVYGFELEGGRLSADYVRRAERISEERLAMAGVRLAAELNRRFCRGG